MVLPPVSTHGDNAGVAIYVGLERQEGSMKTTIRLGIGRGCWLRFVFQVITKDFDADWCFDSR